MSEARGHNSGDVLNKSAQDQLRSILDQIETLDERKVEIAEEIKEKYALAKGNGFDPKTLRKLVALRKKDRAKLKEDNALLELYAHAVGDMDLVS